MAIFERIWKRTVHHLSTSELEDQVFQLMQRRAAGRFGPKEERMAAALNEELARREQFTPTLPSREELRERTQKAFEDHRRRLSGSIFNEEDARSARLAALLDVAVETYESAVPGIAVALKDKMNRKIFVDNLSLEFLPLMWLPSDQLRHCFADYLLWTLTEVGSQDHHDLELVLRDDFSRALSLLPEDTKGPVLASRSQFRWDSLV